MAIQAQMADGRVLQFPDGTDPAVIQATVKRLIAQSPVEAEEEPAEKPGFQPFTELRKGAMRAATSDLPSTWEAAGIFKDVNVATAVQKRLDLFDKIDKGEITSRDQLRGLGDAAGQGRMYLDTSPENRAKLKERAIGEIANRKQLVGAAVKTIRQYQKDAEQYNPAVDRPRDIGSVADFTNWVAGTVGSGAVQIVPLMLAAAATGGVGLGAVSAGMGVAESVSNRLQYIQDQIKDLPPQEQADRIFDYIQKSNDTNLLTGIVSGAFDVVLGPTARLLKIKAGAVAPAATRREAAKRELKATPKQMAEEAVTGTAQEATQIAGEVGLGEQQKFATRENLIRMLEAGATEGVGSVGGAGINVAAAAARRPTGARPPVAEEAPPPEAPPVTPPTAPAAVSQPPVPPRGVTQEEVDAEAYKTLFDAYRSQGMTREDADALARNTLKEREEMEAQATAKAMGTAPEGLTPATGLPPLDTWNDKAIVSTLEFQLAKPEATRNEPLVAALEQQMAVRGLQLPVGEESVAEPVSAPSGEGVSVAGVTPPGAPAEGVAGAERTGVVSTAEDVGQLAVREGEQPASVEKTAEELEAEADAAEAPYKARIAQALDVAKANVSAAFDQRREYGSLQESIDIYRDNVRDTLVELGISDQFTEDAAFRAFDRAVQEGLAKETAASTATTETGAPPTKRGRPKAELTPEQQAAKEAKRTTGRAEYMRADRKTQRAIQTLDELATPLDESEFATDADLKAEQDARIVRKRQAIRDLLEVNPAMRGTAVGQRIREALGRPEITEREKADIQAGIDALKKSGKASLQSTDPTLRKVNPSLANVTNGAQAISVIAKTGTPFQRLIANRLRNVVRKVRVVVVEDGSPVPEGLLDPTNAEAWDGARGLYVEEPDGTQTVYLRGASFGADQGVNNVTALHELLHAATSQKLYLGLIARANRIDVDAQISKFTGEITAIMARASRVYSVMDALGKVPPDLARLVESTLRFTAEGDPYYNIFELPHEFLAYGMSEPTFQKFLNSVPDEKREPTNLFSRFVAAVRQALGIPPDANTTLTSLINATDQVLAGRKTPWMRRVEAAERRNAGSFPRVAAENKRAGERISKVEQKIATSRESQDLVEGTGILTALRKSENLRDLLAAGWDTFNIAKLKALLPALMTDVIVQWSNRLGISGLDRAWRGMQDMSAMRANMMSAAADTTREWLKLQPGVVKRLRGKKGELSELADVMHAATLKGVDPATATTDAELNKRWNALSPQAKEVYKKVRDSYKSYFDLYRLLLDKRIEALNIPGDVKDADTPKGRVMAEIKKLYETSKAISPYFPLMRYGDYWLSIGKGKQREFFMFESPLDRELYLRKRQRQAESSGVSLETDKGNSLTELRNSSVSADTSALLKDIFDAIDGAGALADKEALKDQIYQLYLTTMPEQSFRNQFVHRKGTAGFSGDALRNYITSTMNMANQLSRLKYGPQVLLDIDAARASLEGRPDKDKLEMLVDEMKQRAELELFPPSENPAFRTAANIANRSAFLYYMTSIKTALSQLSSLPIFGAPVLMSRHNPAKVAKEMSRFMLVFSEFGTVKDDNKFKIPTPTIAESKSVKLNPDEQIAIEAMKDRGLADVTLTYDLMDRRDVPTTKYVGAWKAATNMMGALFHNVERLNREVMYLSSFRLTMDELEPKIRNGQISREAAIEQAIEQAVDDTYTALGNFTEGNRPRVARGSVGKVVLQFKTFPAFVTTYLVRNFYRMLPYLNKEGKKEAAIQFFGTIGMSYALAGYVGLPGIDFALGAVQALINSFKDDEDEDPLEELDLVTWLRNVWIPSVFGEVKIGDKPLSEIVDAGVLNSISGYAMNDSLSMNNMWFPELKESASYQAEVQDYALSLAGPFASLVLKQLPAALDDFRAGRIDRGFEKLMPNLIRQPLAAERYRKEGATTPAGDILKDADEFTKGQLAMQALGYRTEGLADVQAINFKVNAIRQKVMQEKNRLIARVDLEATQGSDEALDDAVENVLKFNSRYPSLAVKGDDLARMLKSRREARAKADRGFRVDKKFYPQLQELLEPSRAKIEREAAQ